MINSGGRRNSVAPSGVTSGSLTFGEHAERAPAKSRGPFAEPQVDQAQAVVVTPLLLAPAALSKYQVVPDCETSLRQ
jgi:hypothetical protein